MSKKKEIKKLEKHQLKETYTLLYTVISKPHNLDTQSFNGTLLTCEFVTMITGNISSTDWQNS